MREIIFSCKRHGERTIDEVYKSNDKSCKLGFRYKCKECTYLATRNRPCLVHGDISDEDRLQSGQCRACNFDKMYKLNEIRDNNRSDFNEKQKLKREANPEKYSLINKEKYKNDVSKYGKEVLNESNKARKFGITPEQIRKMIETQNNKCAICNNPETRIFTNKITKEMRVANLCIDHCHITKKIRGLLCHDCNTGIGKFKDDINLLHSAVDYLKRYE